MEKEIYRGKRLNNNEWVFGSLIDWGGNGEQVYIIPFCEQASSLSLWQWVYSFGVAVNPKTVGRFTGLTDKNGKKIFEGDIIAIGEDSIYYHTASGPVRTYKGMWVSFYLPDAHGRDCYDELYRINSEREVIGNIHDNPELSQEE